LSLLKTVPELLNIYNCERSEAISLVYCEIVLIWLILPRGLLLPRRRDRKDKHQVCYTRMFKAACLPELRRRQGLQSFIHPWDLDAGFPCRDDKNLLLSLECRRATKRSTSDEYRIILPWVSLTPRRLPRHPWLAKTVSLVINTIHLHF
jgi:hypothetical protein